MFNAMLSPSSDSLKFLNKGMPQFRFALSLTYYAPVQGRRMLASAPGKTAQLPGQEEGMERKGQCQSTAIKRARGQTKGERLKFIVEWKNLADSTLTK